jgi:predicted RNA-binding protein
MNNLKDKSQTDRISDFVSKQTLRFDTFGQNKMIERAYIRSEKLVSATYLVTRHIDQSEVLKSQVRTSALRVLNSVVDLRDSMRITDSETQHTCFSIIRTTISLVRILAVGGYISIDNATILSESYEELAVFISNAHRSILSETNVLVKDDLVRDTVLYTESRTPRMSDANTLIKDDGVKDKPQTIAPIASIITPPVTRTPHIRSSVIFDTVSRLGPVGIKDICTHLPEYSEKMIQRELFDLVQTGKLSKNGTKRWSRYSIV